MNVKYIHMLKYLTLKKIQHLFEVFGLVSTSSAELGTFDGEEFTFYSEFFADERGELQVLDIGANTGSWSADFLDCLNKVNIKIHAIEPIPEFIELIRNNSDPRIVPENWAIGVDGGDIKIAKIGNGATSFPNTDSDYPESQKELQWHVVPTISGDTLVKNLEIAPALIKIDTDGYDFTVLHTLQRTLLEYHPLVQFEFTHRFARKAKYSLKDVILFLKTTGYRTFVLTSEGKLRKVISPRLEVLNHQTKNFIAIHDSEINIRATPHKSF